MEWAEEDLQRSDATVDRVHIPGWFTSSSKHRVTSVELDENTSLLTRHHNSVSTKKRCSSIYLWRWWRNWLQSLVPSWLARYLESASLCSSFYVKKLTQYKDACILHSWKSKGHKRKDWHFTWKIYKQDEDKVVKCFTFIFFWKSGQELESNTCVSYWTVLDQNSVTKFVWLVSCGL